MRQIDGTLDFTGVQIFSLDREMKVNFGEYFGVCFSALCLQGNFTGADVLAGAL
jgi:hypothetical protein